MAYCGLYDTYHKQQCKGIFDNRKEVAKFTGNTKESVSCALSRNSKLKSRYELVKFKDYEL